MIFPEKFLICPENFFSFSGKNDISGNFLVCPENFLR